MTAESVDLKVLNALCKKSPLNWGLSHITDLRRLRIQPAHRRCGWVAPCPTE